MTEEVKELCVFFILTNHLPKAPLPSPTDWGLGSNLLGDGGACARLSAYCSKALTAVS